MSKFHNYYLNLIKEKSNSSFVAWETYNGKTRLKMIIKGENKYLNLTGDFNGVNIETYSQILKELL